MDIIRSDQPDFKMRVNNILPVFWNFFRRIEAGKLPLGKIKTEMNKIVDRCSPSVASRNLQYFINVSDNGMVKELFEDKVQALFLSDAQSKVKERKTSLQKARPGYSDRNPLLNYRKLKWTYGTYLKNVDLHITNEKLVNELGHKLSYDEEIYNVAHRALIEIQDLVLTPNNNAERLLKDAFDETNRLIDKAEKIINKSRGIFMDVPKYQSFYSNRQVIVNFNWDIRILLSKGNNPELGEPYVDKILSEAIAKGLRPPMQEYYQFINSRKEEQKNDEKKVIQRIEIAPLLNRTQYNEEYFRSKSISLVLGEFCDMFKGLYYAMNCFCNDNPTDIKYSTFESHLENLTLIDTERLYLHIEYNLLNKLEHKETLHNIITIKIQGIEGLLNTVKKNQYYNKYKAEKINIPVNGKMLMHPYLLSRERIEDTKSSPEISFELMDSAMYCPCYGTLETFYNATIVLFNDAKDRINRLFSSQQSILHQAMSALPAETSVDTSKPAFNSETLKRLEYTNKNGYILSDKLEGFKEIESELLKRGFIDERGNWIKEKNKLCAFIHLLHGTYLKTKLPKKETWPSLLCYRRFFERRYTIDISKAFQESQFPPSSVKNFIPDFKFVIPTEDLQ